MNTESEWRKWRSRPDQRSQEFTEVEKAIWKAGYVFGTVSKSDKEK